MRAVGDCGCLVMDPRQDTGTVPAAVGATQVVEVLCTHAHAARPDGPELRTAFTGGVMSAGSATTVRLPHGHDDQLVEIVRRACDEPAADHPAQRRQRCRDDQGSPAGCRRACRCDGSLRGVTR